AGERDIIKVLQLMPGVKRGGEGGTDMYVRGGGADQNLVLLDEATVYNSGHLLGFFSVFNSNSIKEVNLYKSAFPAQYGGRLSSILDIKMKEGNEKAFETKGSVGLIASNLSIEGPIIKDKMSFAISGRRTYLDKVIQWTVPENVFRFPYYFYDLNAKINYKINKKDRLYFSSYLGRDILYNRVKDSTSVLPVNLNTFLGNFTVTSRWNHYYKNIKLFHNLTVVHSQFRYNIDGNFAGNSLLIKSSINDLGVKLDYDYHMNPEHWIKFGAVLMNHTFKPNIITTQGVISDLLKSKSGSKIYNQEMGFYFNDEYTVNHRIKVNYGARLSGTYVQNTFYHGFEPRVSGKYSINSTSSIKASYAKMKQYLHLVRSSSIALPTDLWYPVTKNVAPGKSNQVSLGYYKSINKYKTTFSVETYYKWLNDVIDYKEGAVLFLNDNYESELVKGNAKAYGFEFLAQKDVGKLSGWIAYTLSWSKSTFPDLNGGKTFFSNNDRRHDISVVANYEFNKRFSMSAVYVYSSGRPFTPRISQFLMPNPTLTNVDVLPIYTDRNTVRLHAARRLDIDICYKNKPSKKTKLEWHLSIYNFFARTQPQRIVITQDANGNYKYQEKGLFGIIIAPALNFNF
ncbi:MAG: TonB-dependent receptor plug domain-containing protein, partial [Bacteroidetes bacterium]|nr:TonB-dependent receptor plug domain-containing protein [Bacteroidota bacterium]